VFESFTYELASERRPNAVLHAAVEALTGPMNDSGYRLTTQSEAAVTYERIYRPWNIWVSGLILVPVLVGIPILVTQARVSTITLLMEQLDYGTRILIRGTAPPQVRKAITGIGL
jgi:hypothetical protein